MSIKATRPGSGATHPNVHGGLSDASRTGAATRESLASPSGPEDQLPLVDRLFQANLDAGMSRGRASLHAALQANKKRPDGEDGE